MYDEIYSKTEATRMIREPGRKVFKHVALPGQIDGIDIPISKADALKLFRAYTEDDHLYHSDCIAIVNHNGNI